MMLFILVGVFLTVALAVWGVALLVSRRDPTLKRRVEELEFGLPGTVSASALGFPQESQAKGLRRLVHQVGKKVPASAENVGALRRDLMRAGYRDPSAAVFYVGIRILLAVGLPLLLLVTVVPGMPSLQAVVILGAAAGIGFILPSFMLGRLVRRRQTKVTDALPDTLDLLVVCVEAGLGLNQALMRVGTEMGAVEPVIGDEFNLVNLEMRAGKSRMESLKNLARRTGVEDIGSLVSMLVQTDKFGTSVATSLRVFSESMRTKRRQRAEEKAAKTTIKMVFPLALCVLPALFVVVLGPAALHIFDTLVKSKG
jgi:tight adherence protein C